MRKTMMATASAFALALSTAAFAADATQPGAEAATDDVLQQQTGATTAETGAAGSGAGEMPGMGGESYADLDDEAREGFSFAAGQDDWDADELIGAKVVDADGEEIGEIEDLIADEGQTIDRAVIKVSGDDGEERFVVVRLDELERAEGDDADELTLNRTAMDGDYFMGESSFEKQDGRWEPSAL